MSDEPDHFGEPLSDEERAVIDDKALALSRQFAKRRSHESYRDLTSWLVQRTPMPLRYETQRVEETHADTVARYQLGESSDEAASILGRLVDRLPEALKPNAGADTFELTVVECAERISASGGQNRLYISTGLLRWTLGTACDHDRLAFLIARLIAASSLGHARAWYQKEWASLLVGRESNGAKRIETDNVATDVFSRVASAADTFDQDLFAFHLCRQAGFDTNAVLDVFRRPGRGQTDESEGSRLSLARLRRLLMESRGLVSAGESQSPFGLFCFCDGKWQRVPNGSLGSNADAVVMIHGLGSDLSAFKLMTRELVSSLEKSTTLLGFRYPETDSLYRSSKFLLNELHRVGLRSEFSTFVCHSAGGLVFRRAAEVDGMKFRAAALIGTPNRGSDLTSLRPLLEVQEFFSAFRGSFSVPDLLKDDSSQLVRDLEPASLFLAELNRSAPPSVTNSYRIARGDALSSTKIILLTLGIGTAQAALQSLAESKLNGSRQQAAKEWIARIRLPEEVRSGDLAVTLASATTQNPADVLTVATSHTKLPDDPRVIDFIKRIISE